MLEPTEAACLVHLSQKMNKQTREAIQFQIRTKKSLHSNRTLMPKENMFHNTLCDQKQVLGAQKVTSGHKNSPSPPLPSFVPPSLWKYFSSAYCEEETQRETKGEGEKTEPLFSRRRYRNIRQQLQSSALSVIIKGTQDAGVQRRGILFDCEINKI